MRLIYSLSIYLYTGLIRVFAFMDPKAKKFTEGRKNLFQQIKQKVNPKEQPIWFHFASLGEFEQGRAVLQELKKHYPQKKILITFFSPSGYEIRKDTDLADYVFYLPMDTAPNARYFLDLINPAFAIFTKYEYWFHFFNELEKRKIPLLMISAIYRPNQLFFKPWGFFFRNILKKVHYFFVQNEESLVLLKNIGLKNVSLAGDTRFDRVNELSLQKTKVPYVADFLNGKSCLVAGSTWPSDEKLLAELINKKAELKLILAPHEVYPNHIKELQQLFENSTTYSALKEGKGNLNANVLIVDGIGLLSYLYPYGQFAYIGGGFGAGIHNTLEAATYGRPVIFGPKYENFQEAKDLLNTKAGFSVSSAAELHAIFEYLNNHPDELRKASENARNYVQGKSGATAVIVQYIREKFLEA
ncbi:MAG TPA: glycosyltransferase N-terminal domain-containing protein [Sphingobacterium sp.]|nr:glycosyltransferase N-terminal domain-containing protein [Sphingobacterium sp.]